MVLKKLLNKYLIHRKKSIKEMRLLLYQKDKITKQIRIIKKELHQWDSYLLGLEE